MNHYDSKEKCVWDLVHVIDEQDWWIDFELERHNLDELDFQLENDPIQKSRVILSEKQNEIVTNDAPRLVHASP